MTPAMFSSAALFPSLEPEAANSALRDGAVLVVEDEDSLADLLHHLLLRVKIRVLRAADGAQARQLFAKHRAAIALALVDCHLPDMGGAELCQELRAVAPGLPLLITSGRDQRALAATLAPGGPTAFLPKPYMPGEVVRRVTALLPATG